jgi:bifunctional non-homologous end joining protein LigD
MKPMLAEKCPKWLSLNDLLNGDFAVEQKIDGHRMVLEVIDQETRAYNRKGEEIGVPVHVAAVFDQKAFNGKWIFDGEYLGETFYAFDCMAAGKSNLTAEHPYKDRRAVLEAIMNKLSSSHSVKLAPAAKPGHEWEFYNLCVENHLEGVIFKGKHGTYSYGERTMNTIKWKFTKAIDAIVTELRREGKDRSVSIGVYNTDGTGPIPIGSIKIPDALVDNLPLDSVVEVEYLYYDSKLVQPVFKRVRDDKTADECTFSQISARKNALVLEPELVLDHHF